MLRVNINNIPWLRSNGMVVPRSRLVKAGTVPHASHWSSLAVRSVAAWVLRRRFTAASAVRSYRL